MITAEVRGVERRAAPGHLIPGATRAPRTGHLDDAALLARVGRGDEAAFSVLHDRYRSVVVSVVRSRLDGRDAGECDDIVQEVFTVAWQNLGDLRDPGRLRPWLLQIARRATIDHGRRRRCRPVVDRDLDAHTLGGVPDHRPGPAAEAEGSDLAERLRRGLGALSPRDVLILHLVAGRGLGLSDVAAALDITPNNAAVSLHRARHRLRIASVGDPSPAVGTQTLCA